MSSSSGIIGTLEKDDTVCWLKIVYDQLAEGKPIDKLGIPHPNTFYIRYLIQEKFGVRYSTKKVEQLLLETGLLPMKTAGVPRWFYEKYEPNEVRAKG